ncbi:uncharacterized protein LOC115728217 isoform X2 [Rhodamnia argentea]|uniref:Uncharacterized protein LOC115728217 isoform X2 n=1 Tax=Rhodamnia argentea TaxID=178133 RepID=A0A8B8MWC5_9MYRT|nr:uncharacterized protein LOC115728217 isoform X2 [Rhodamnia argentea]
MDSPPNYSRPYQLRSGYEPSDTETEWQENPRREQRQNDDDLEFGGPKVDLSRPRNITPLKLSRRQPSFGGPSPKKETEAASVRRRHSSKSPYKPRRDNGNALSPIGGSDACRNVSPLSKPEHWRHISPYRPGREENANDENEITSSNRNSNRRTRSRDDREGHLQLLDLSRVSLKSNYGQRSVTAPKQRARDREQHNNSKGERTLSPLERNVIQKQREASPLRKPSVGEINEMVANLKLYRGPATATTFESTDSISPGDIFFSRDDTALAFQKNVFPRNDGQETRFVPPPKTVPHRDVSHQRVRSNGGSDNNPQGSASSLRASRTTPNSNSNISRQSSNRNSTVSSKMSDFSAGTTDSIKKFTANRRKSQTETWFACMRKGSCRTSKSPEPTRAFDEASFIEKAFVVENLRQFWADKHQPHSLDGFSCHKQEAQLLKKLVSNDVCPHILLKGPSGSGKRALTMALLHEIYGDQSWNVTHELRSFHIQEKRPTQVIIPLASSAHHVELNAHKEANSRIALMALVKEISSNHAIIPEVSHAGFKADHKVIVLYEIDKAAENVQHLIKWIIDCYSDSCKLILCCEDDGTILESVKNRCKVIKVDAPITHEIMEILIQIARKEDFELPMSFAAKIATKSRQNLRKAIMALEACKAHNYPFIDNQPIPLGWEEVLVELTAEILADPTQKRLFFVRGKIQKLLVDFVHPKLILLQKLAEQFLKAVEAGSKRDLYYWHAYYDKRLPTGTTALLKLEGNRKS